MQNVFPDPTPYEDVVAVSPHLTQKLLIEGYSKGFFPWPHDGIEGIPWFHPVARAVLFLNEIKINATLEKAIRRSRTRLTFTLNENFAEVLRACAESSRPGQSGTWITEEITWEYGKLHDSGYAHSIEAWNAEKNLVGGIYGVYAGGVFSAESMFYREPDASKLCLLQLAQLLREKSHELIDIQMLTPHLVKLGAREITRPTFLRSLRKTGDRPKLFESQSEACRPLASL